MGMQKHMQEEPSRLQAEISALRQEESELYKLILADTATDRQRRRYRALGVIIAAKEEWLSGEKRGGYETGIKVCNHYNS